MVLVIQTLVVGPGQSMLIRYPAGTLRMMGDGLKLDADDSWECQHARRSGEPASSTRLRIDGMAQPNLGRPTSTRQRITCPDCGTLWRVWTDLRVAKPAVEWSAADTTRAVRRAPVLDIDRVVDLVAADLPDSLLSNITTRGRRTMKASGSFASHTS